MSFILASSIITNPQNLPVTLTANSAGPYFIGLTYTWQITNLDSYVTYTASGNPSGSASVNTSTGVLTYVPATGDTGFLINNRAVNLTLTTPVGFLATLGGASSDYGQGIAVDSSGNVYVVGYSNASGTDDFQLTKYNTSGTIQWQRRLGGGASSDTGYGIAVDASGNVYVVGYSDASGTNDFQLAKYNTSGTIQWQRRLGGAATDGGQGIAVDSSGNVYVVGYSVLATAGFQLAKYNTSGTIQWQRRLGGGASSDTGYGIAVDSSGNVYVVGYSDASGSNDFQLAKYNTSGTIQWQRRLGGGASSDVGYGIAVDASGNVYVVGLSNASGTNDFQLAKYNTSGTIQWQRRLGGATSDGGFGIAVDASGNVYVVGYSDASGTNDFQLAKYNTSGTIQWQRRLGGATTDVGYGIAVDASGNVYVVGYSNASGTNDFLLGKFPGDGSGTGTITVGALSFTYAASTLTDAATTLTDAATTLTDAASTLTDAASTLTDAASTLTSTTGLF